MVMFPAINPIRRPMKFKKHRRLFVVPLIVVAASCSSSDDDAAPVTDAYRRYLHRQPDRTARPTARPTAR